MFEIFFFEFVFSLFSVRGMDTEAGHSSRQIRNQWDLSMHCPQVVISWGVHLCFLAFIQHLTACLIFSISSPGVLVTRTQWFLPSSTLPFFHLIKAVLLFLLLNCWRVNYPTLNIFLCHILSWLSREITDLYRHRSSMKKPFFCKEKFLSAHVSKQ